MEIIHPDWEYKLWTHDEIFDDLYKDDEFLQTYVKDPEVYRWAFIADRVRLLLLRDFGGVYVDLDARPIRSFNEILNKLTPQHTFFAGMKELQSNHTLIDCTVYGSSPNSRIVNEILKVYKILEWAHGCKTFSDVIITETDTDVALFNYRHFYDDKITKDTIVLHDVMDTRLFSWVREEHSVNTDGDTIDSSINKML